MSSLRSVSVLSILALAARCTPKRNARSTALHGADSSAARGVADAAESPRAEPRVARLTRALCGGSPNCRVEDFLPAGADERGQTLTVARVIQAPEPDPGGDDAGDESACRSLAPLEYWLVVESGPTVASQLLSRLSRTSGDCADLGDDRVEVRHNEVTRTQISPSAASPSASLVARLSPLTWLRETQERRYNGAVTLHIWDWESFSGASHWYQTPADVVGADPDLVDFDVERSREATHATPIPVLSLPADYVAEAWRTSGLGLCSLRVDGVEGRGVALAGRGDAADAELRVVVTHGGDVLAEVRDDRWVGGAQGDRLQVFFVPEAAPGQVAPTPRVVTLRLADGGGALLRDEPVAGLRVERAVDPLPGRAASARFKITLPSLVSELTGRCIGNDLAPLAAPLVLVYSDVDPTSPRVERRIATSAAPRGRAAPVGAFRCFDAGVATCEPRAGLLEPRITRAIQREQEAVVPPPIP